MRLRRIVLRTLAVLAGLAAVLVLAVVVILALRIPFDIEPAKPVLQSLLTRELGRNVSLSGPIYVAPSFSPMVELNDVVLDSPPGFGGPPMAKLGQVRLSIKALPLLWFKIHIEEFSARDLKLYLASLPDGRANWAFSSKAPKKEPAPDPSKRRRLPKISGDSLVIDRIDLENIAAKLSTEDGVWTCRLASCTGSGRAGEPFTLSMNGTVDKTPFDAGVRIGSLADFLKTQRAWMDLGVNTAGIALRLSGDLQLPLENAAVELEAGVCAPRLDGLSRLLGVDLPPLKDISANATVHVDRERARLSQLLIQVGASRLTGNATVAKGPPLTIRAGLDAEMLQLDDFDTPGWSAITGSTNSTGNATTDEAANATAASPSAVAASGEQSGPSPSALFSEKLLRAVDARLTVTVGDVVSGKDHLGRGRLDASMGGGRFDLERLDVELPGGAVHLSAGLGASNKTVDASLRALVDDFDLGVLARRYKPDTDMGGRFSLDVDLSTKGASPYGLMANATGHFYAAAAPRNFKAGIIDLWAVNLFSAVMEGVDGDASMINCVMALLSMKKGIMTTDLVAADTTRMRVAVDGKVDFRKGTLSMRAVPASKRPQFFSLGTPVGVSGKFQSFGLDVSGFDIAWTVVKFVSSPLAVPVERIFAKDMPADGSDLCTLNLQELAKKAGAGE